MPALDFASLSLLTFASMVVVALALPFAMGRDAISPGARCAQRYFLLQALAWACIVAASRLRATPLDFGFSVLATLAVSTAQWQMAHALQHWLGPRSGRRWLLLCCLAGPLGFMALWQVLPWRFAWFSAAQGLGLLLLAHMCLYPQRTSEKGWRTMLCAAAGTMAVVLLLRAVLALHRPDLLPHFAAQTPLNHGFVVLGHIVTILSLVAVLVAWRNESHRRLSELALTDMLTGIANRRAFEEQGLRLLALAQRQHRPVSVVLIDLDYFKRINDQHGHATGDQALRLFAATVQGQLRAGDMVARWGGEEFSLLVQAAPVDVLTLHQRLVEAVQQRTQEELGFVLQFSAGCASAADSAYQLEALVQRADEALYQAKQAGRAQLVFEVAVSP